jgi:dihydrodipicolinate synthase/N-acetylneuraminate lyase
MNTEETRDRLTATVLPDGIPRLWCPLLTHYREDHTIDEPRMKAHFTHIVPWVKGFLMPGSTGDGWELDADETSRVTELAVTMAQEHNARVLLGALKSDADSMDAAIEEMLRILYRITGEEEIILRLIAAHVCGFTVTPPTGTGMSQAAIHTALARIMEKDLPIALYQLPQVTQSETAPDTFERLVTAYANMIFFKDSSGNDGIALSDCDKGNVYLVRGAEGEYARWLKDAGGRYDGFLLSTANCFARELMQIIRDTESGNTEAAASLSGRLTDVIDEMFALVQPVTSGNAFTNANKAIDHFGAYGPSAAKKEGPMLHGKIRLPADIIAATGDILTRYDLMPARGYLE